MCAELGPFERSVVKCRPTWLRLRASAEIITKVLQGQRVHIAIRRSVSPITRRARTGRSRLKAVVGRSSVCPSVPLYVDWSGDGDRADISSIMRRNSALSSASMLRGVILCFSSIIHAGMLVPCQEWMDQPSG
jgi:hypothetical protein